MFLFYVNLPSIIIKMFMNDLDIKEKKRIRDFVSGLIAGIISVTVCNPLDITRTRLNLMVLSY